MNIPQAQNKISKSELGGGFQLYLTSLTWGNDPIWLICIFFKWVGEKPPTGEKGYLGVSKNKGTPKWMVYNGKPY